MSWSWSYRCFVSYQMLGTKFRWSVRAADSLTCWAVSPALDVLHRWNRTTGMLASSFFELSCFQRLFLFLFFVISCTSPSCPFLTSCCPCLDRPHFLCVLAPSSAHGCWMVPHTSGIGMMRTFTYKTSWMQGWLKCAWEKNLWELWATLWGTTRLFRICCTVSTRPTT